MSSRETVPLQFGARHYLSVFTIATLLAFSLLAALDLETANALTNQLRDATLSHFDWLFTLTASVVLLAMFALLFHPGASIRIGTDDARPEFSRLSWFAMLFSAGLASGLIYWSSAEPVMHFEGNPFTRLDHIPPESRAAVIRAITVTIFHWGLHGWGFYVAAGLAIGLASYRHKLPLTFSAALSPVLGEERMRGLTGQIIDLLALYGTIFGVATSIGLAVGSMNATMEPWLHLPLGLTSQLAIIVVVSFLAIFSAVSGVAKGIRRLSEINILVSILLLLAILIMGPTLYLLKLMPASLWDYLSNVIPMGFWTAEKARNQAWQGAWTVFYWGWWLAWMPFVALFVARISKGRTVREFILGVLLVPSAMVLAWMTIFGGTALYQEVQQGTDINQIVNTDYSLGMVALIQGLHVPALETPLYIVVSFLLFSWLITSLDSATLVICHILHVDHLNSMKIFWGFILGTVTATLLLMGGIGALQAASIIVGLPMAFLALLMIVACYRFIHQG